VISREVEGFWCSGRIRGEGSGGNGTGMGRCGFSDWKSPIVIPVIGVVAR
jgi:hypothetical protein